MHAFEDTSLWRSAFPDDPVSEIARAEVDFFKQQFQQMRARAELLVSRIAADMPGYTVHDITHLDALWETASLVAHPDITLNPPEAFVLGGAILLHDAGMTLAGYKGGLAELKTTPEWADIAALHGENYSEENLQVEVLRQLHPVKAEELATQSWDIDSDSVKKDPIFLIDQFDLRKFYGRTIGLLAHSHWWSVSRVERDLSNVLGPLPPFTRQTVDNLKLAALLRVADALHLDRRRAPYFRRALERPNGVSSLHWRFQEKLSFPRIAREAVIFTSGDVFRRNDADAWWLAYDTLAMADRELEDTDRLLRSNDRPGLAARRVEGIGKPVELSRHIPVSGWRPVDTRLRVTDIPRIVRTFGGEQLYGDSPTVPIRELLQNATDAIQARRRIQGRAPEWGQITVELNERDGLVWLCVEDTGVGMSEAVLTGPLLDFGSSFWGTQKMIEEFPGLAAKGMNSLGRFGVGFFSVFMLGDRVRVISRRYDRAETDSLELEFNNGIASRPVLASALPGGAPVDGGTRVEIALRVDPRHGKELAFYGHKKETKDTSFDTIDRSAAFSSLVQLVTWLAPASSVSIDVIEFGKQGRAVTAGDWLKISPRQLISRLSSKDLGQWEPLLREIRTADGRVLGRAALAPSDWQSPSVLTAGGLRVSRAGNLIGVISGSVSVASRNRGVSNLPSDAVSAWASEQAMLLEQLALPDAEKARCSELILRSKGSIGSLPIASLSGSWLNTEQMKHNIRNSDFIEVISEDISYEDYDPVPKYIFESEFELVDNLYKLPTVGRQQSSSLSYIISLCEEIWGGCDEEDDYDRVIGEILGEEITRSVNVLRRPEPDDADELEGSES